MIKLLTIFILTMSCQDYNSNSGDKFRYGPLNLEDNDSAFARAYVILQVRCANCHQHSAWAAYKSNQAWKDAGLAVGGNPDVSSVINRIRNYEGTGSNMPIDSGPIPDDEYTALTDWVQALPP